MKMEFVVVVHVRERSSNENLYAEKVEMKYAFYKSYFS
jgi:hypothetical protein